jgi:hypothetical protein
LVFFSENILTGFNSHKSPFPGLAAIDKQVLVYLHRPIAGFDQISQAKFTQPEV